MTGTLDLDATGANVIFNRNAIDATSFGGHIYFVSYHGNAFTPANVALHATNLYGPFEMFDEVGSVIVPAAAGGDGTDIPWPMQAIPTPATPQAVGY